LADARAVREASVQNAIADALAVLEATAIQDATVIERLMVATTLEELAQQRVAAGIGDGPASARKRAPSNELWRAVHDLERRLRVEHDVYAGRYVDDEILVRVGLVDRVGVITQRLRREFAFPSRLHVFAADFSLAQLEETERKIGADFADLVGRGVPILAYGLAVLRNRVEIEVECDVERHGAFLRERYGPTVVVERGEVAVVG
jgi:hypothetical protein